jgi:hypothetical protein
MKYLIIKAWNGFGDRLQCLKMVLEFLSRTKVPVLIDWSDSIWSHGSESFYKYFKIDLPTFNIEDIPEDATVFPPFWKDKLSLKLTKCILDEHHKEIEINGNQHFFRINFDTDVVVYTASGFRTVYRDVGIFMNVFTVIHPIVLQKVRERNQRYKLESKIGIHLRGTDRATKIDKEKRMAELNIKLVGLGILNGQEFIAVSDDPDFIKIWKSKYTFPVLTEIGNLGGREGVHNKKADGLFISKEELNIDLLVDFFTLASCKRVVSTSNDSRFAQEANSMHSQIKRILA